MSILIDTDPGIDDAIAILYALRSGMDVAAITTVAGNIGLPVTTRNALRLVTLANRQVPVHAGAAAPLTGANRPELAVHGDEGLGGVALPEPDREVAAEGAVTAMARHITAAPPRAVTLFCLGPLTNLAHLIANHPEAAARLGPVIAMGGALDVPGNMGARAEFNLAQDPLAAARVLAAGLDLTLIPLDATRQFRADRAFVQALTDAAPPAAQTASQTASQTAARLIAAYFAASTGRESRPLHDPCVPLFHARPDLFRTERHRLDVDPASGALDSGGHPVKVVLALDARALAIELRRGLAA